MDLKKKSIITALMVAMFLAAVEGTIVMIAVPTIAKELKGFENVSLIFSVYLLTSAISTPIYGKLADLFGRKNMLSIGIIIFLTGSTLCGFSQTMNMLILFRAVQGLGAGSIYTITHTIVGDQFKLEQRPKIQGAIGAVWGIASLAGPFLGGFIIDAMSWHWLFFINLPFGFLSVALLQKSLHENFKKKKHQMDYAGIITFSAAMILFLNMFLSNENFGIDRTAFIGLSAGAVILLLWIFYAFEKRAKEPIIPFDIFTRTNVLINAISFLSAMLMIGTSVYFPIYLQNVLGFNATVAGLLMAPMNVSWFLPSIVLGKYIVKIGGKAVIIILSSITLVSTVLLIFLNINSSVLQFILYTFIMGIGLGGTFTTLTIVVQSSVAYHKRGAAMSLTSLLRTLGQIIGVSIFGAAFNFYIVKYFSKIGIYGIDPGNMYASSVTDMAVTNEQIKMSLNSSLHYLYIIFIGIAILCILLIIMTPNISCDMADDLSDNGA